jgi:hypothetical protein
VRAGERPTYAAQAEGVHPATVFRAMAKDRPQRLFLTIEPLAEGFNMRVENQRSRRVSKDYRYATLADLQTVLPHFFTWMKTKLQR